ncbi:hypothetical protein ON010_g5420 [Phytophthora cinnamomi]|nr:hypothetical protein ON010_g5420 [Phytophthora cinnamomi]
MAPRKAKRRLDDTVTTSSTTSKRNARGSSTRQSLRPRKAPENEIDELANSDEDDSSGEFEVEAILREEGDLFVVKWAVYDSEDNTWEREDHLKPDLVMQFRQSSKRRAKPTQQDHVDSDAELEAAIEHPATGTASSGAGTVSEGADRADTTSNLIGARVAFAPSNEAWMPEADYGKVGSAYLTGIIARIKKPDGTKKASKRKKSWGVTLYDVRWTLTQFQLQRRIHGIPRAKVLERIKAYDRLSGNELRPETWDVLCRPYQEETKGGDIWDEFEQVDEAYAR